MLIHPPALQVPAPAISSHQCSQHPMRYHLALPQGWVKGRTYPVLVVIPDAAREFKANLARFIHARGARPYLLVAPEVITCGGSSGQKTPPHTYTASEWRAAQRAGEYTFDDEGLGALLAEVQQRWGGAPKAFLTGWEAGGHTVWAQTFRRPERWRAVAVVSPNYQGRGLTESTFSTSPTRASLPIRVFWCGAPTGEAVQGLPHFHKQTDQALKDAHAHGFAPIPMDEVPGQDHGPLPEAVMEWCDGLQ